MADMLIPKHIISHSDVWFQKTKLVMVNILSLMLQKQGFSHQWVTLQWLQPSFIYSFFFNSLVVQILQTAKCCL